MKHISKRNWGAFERFLELVRFFVEVLHNSLDSRVLQPIGVLCIYRNHHASKLLVDWRNRIFHTMKLRANERWYLNDWFREDIHNFLHLVRIQACLTTANQGHNVQKCHDSAVDSNRFSPCCLGLDVVWLAPIRKLMIMNDFQSPEVSFHILTQSRTAWCVQIQKFRPHALADQETTPGCRLWL